MIGTTNVEGGQSYSSSMKLNPLPLNALVAGSTQWELQPTLVIEDISPRKSLIQTRSSWVNCALRDEEAVYWVSFAHYEAVAVGN